MLSQIFKLKKQKLYLHAYLFTVLLNVFVSTNDLSHLYKFQRCVKMNLEMQKSKVPFTRKYNLLQVYVILSYRKLLAIHWKGVPSFIIYYDWYQHAEILVICQGTTSYNIDL